MPPKIAPGDRRKRPRAPSPDHESERPGKKHKEQQPSRNRKTHQPLLIPDRLQDFIHRSSFDFFELTFSIDHLDGLQRLAWGIDLPSKSIIVCLKFGHKNDGTLGHVRFCVHSRGEDHGPRLVARHHFCSTKSDAVYAITKPCTSRSNIMTTVLSRELYEILGPRGCRKLDVVYDKITEIIKTLDPTKSCLICDKKFDVKIYTPTACLGKCLTEFEKWPLRARLSHLLMDAKSFDFLLCSIYTAVDGQKAVPQAYKQDTSLLVDCPLELHQIQPAIDSFPAISDKLSMKDLLKKDGSAPMSAHRRQLLSWLPQRFRGCMIALKPDAKHFIPLSGAGVKDNQYQFMVLNSRPERHERFMNELSKNKDSFVAFHGCRGSGTWNILTDALKDPSTLPYQRTNVGIFYANTPAVSVNYAAYRGLLRGWKASQFINQQWAVVFGIELALSSSPFANGQSSTTSESKVMIRYVFLVQIPLGPLQLPGPPFVIDQIAMKNSYNSLVKATLTDQDVGLSKTQVSKAQDSEEGSVR